MSGRGLALVIFLGCSALKVPWEVRLADERKRIMFGPDVSPMSMKLRDSLGQGMTLAALGGFRGIVANFLWLSVTTAWEEQQWTRLRTLADMVVLLQPRVSFFWENAGWHLAYNASVSVEKFSGGSKGARNVESMRWIKQGIDFYERGIQAIPEKPKLYEMLALLYQQRLEDHVKAAQYYELASQKPGAPVYLERFVGFSLEKAGKKQEAYDYWVKLWRSSVDHGQGPRRWPMIQERIRNLEKELLIPLDKRVFPD
jgi:hypothetical protein